MFKHFKNNLKLIAAVMIGAASISALAYINHIPTALGGH
jgi:hypothetical protein